MKGLRVLFLVLFLFSVGGVFLGWTLFRPITKGTEDRVFVINQGDSARLIATRLESENLIRSRWPFLVYLKLTGTSKNIQAGSFRIKTNSTIPELVGQLTDGRLDSWVTLLEGWRREEMAQRLEVNLGLAATDFMVASRGREGFLFPDSYLFPVGVSADVVVDTMVDNFQNKWRSVEKKTSLNQKEVVVLASLVEREARSANDRAMVAGILLKRLVNSWPLQVDATVQYVKANAICLKNYPCDWWPVVYRNDLKIVSPYNTYINTGLPPEPICNPSLSSIESVLNSTTSDYWFYLTDKDGQMYFARTVEEHNENIRRFL